MYYEKRKRAKMDRCNICGQTLPLTWDHVPPKFCDNYRSKEYNLCFGVDQHSRKEFPWTSQDGIKFRSLCNHCNNELLGTKYDAYYRHFVNQVKLCLDSSLYLPSTMHYEIAVNRVARSIVGHMLAAKNAFAESTVDMDLRDYFLDTSARPPEGYRLYYRLHPYSQSFVARDIVCGRIQHKDTDPIPTDICSCINAFPLAFLLVTKTDHLPFNDLFAFCNGDIDYECCVPLYSGSIFFEDDHMPRPYNWPCNIADDTQGSQFIVVGDSVHDIVAAKNK